MQARRATRFAGAALGLLGLALSTTFAAHSGGEPAPDAAASRVIKAARAELGDAYEWAGTGPERWDCSGLTYTLWRAVADVNMPRTSRQQQAWAWPLTREQLRPGDLVFWGDPVNHVGLYVGNGKVVDASSSRKKVVERAIWTTDTVRFGRVPRAGVARPTNAGSASPRATSRGAVPAETHSPARRDPRAAAMISLARRELGHGWSEKGRGPTYDAAGLVRWAWASARLGWLPDTPAAIERRTTPVDVKDLRVGDLVFYGDPSLHVGIYVGHGEMIDSSKVLKKVVERRVFTSETVRFGRLHWPRKK